MKSEFQKIIDSNKSICGLKNTTVMITGATGTIGSYMLSLLCYYNGNYNADIKLICPVRDPKKVIGKYSDSVIWTKYDLKDEFDFDFDVDYLIHCAGPTRSADMVQKPIETINAIFYGTQRLLEYFKKHGGKGFLYLSSVEIYGENFDPEKIFSENTVGAVDTLKVRSSYPEAKRLAENLCVAYASQYNLPIKIARLSQILGVGDGDNRLIAYLCGCAKNKEPVILKSDGKATKAYCCIADCVSAMIYILVKGENTAYNVADEKLILPVRDLAEFVSGKYIGKDVIIENKETTIYPQSSYLVMSAAKLRGLGWHPNVGLEEAFDSLIYKDEK